MEEIKKEKSWLVTFLLCLFLGTLGIHRFYVRKNKSAIIQLLTLGGFGLWAFIDLIIIANQKFKDIKGNEIKESKKENIKIATGICIIVVIINVFILIRGIKGINTLREEMNRYEEEVNNINMEVFINTYATPEEEQKLKDELKNINGIVNIEYKSKEIAYQEMQEILGERFNLNEDNFPASYEITILEKSRANEIYDQILLLDNVKSVNNSYNSLKQVDIITSFIKLYNVTAICSVIHRMIYAWVVIATIFIINKYKETRN